MVMRVCVVCRASFEVFFLVMGPLCYLAIVFLCQRLLNPLQSQGKPFKASLSET